MRSLLFVPGDSPGKLEKSLTSGADALIIDLEDSVAHERKSEARKIAADFIAASNGKDGPRLFVRVNDLASDLTEDDLAAVMPADPAAIVLPKSNGANDVAMLSVKLRVHEAISAIDDGSTMILPIITETAGGVFGASSYSATTPRLLGLTWGAEDLSAVIGARSTRDEAGRYRDVFRFARVSTILAAANAGVAAVDTVFPNFRDMDAFRADCIEAERDGFTARMAIHPAQVPVINEVFTPSPEAVAQARALVAAFEEAGNPGVVAIAGSMYDRPHLSRAVRLLERAASAQPGT